MSGKPQYYPRSLSYTLNKLNSYSRQKFKIISNISQSATISQGGTLIISLPENSIVDLDTFSVFFKASTNGGGLLPRDYETLFSSVRVEINGIMVDNVPNYNLLFRKFADMTMGDKTSIRSVLQNGAGFNAAAASNVAVSNAEGGVWQWLGFLGSAQPRCIDSSILGTIRVHLTLAGNEILTVGTNGNTGFNLTDIYSTIDTLAINDSQYYSVIQERLSNSDNPIEIPFSTFTAFSPGTTSLSQTTTGTIATGSLDCLLATYQDSNVLANEADTVLATSRYFKTGSANVLTANFTINNSAYPNFSQNVKDNYLSTLAGMNLAQDTVGAGHSNLNTLDAWKQHAFTSWVRLNHPVGSDERLILIGA
jgi:hypothetical protein